MPVQTRMSIPPGAGKPPETERYPPPYTTAPLSPRLPSRPCPSPAGAWAVPGSVSMRPASAYRNPAPTEARRSEIGNVYPDGLPRSVGVVGHGQVRFRHADGQVAPTLFGEEPRPTSGFRRPTDRFRAVHSPRQRQGFLFNGFRPTRRRNQSVPARRPGQRWRGATASARAMPPSPPSVKPAYSAVA